MKTLIKKSGDTVIVTMHGQLDFETHIPLRDDLTKLIDSSKESTAPQKIIFNLEKLEFVGSSGISSFVQTLMDFNVQAPIKPKYCHVKSEFKKIIKAFDEEELFEIHDNEDHARKSFDYKDN